MCPVLIQVMGKGGFWAEHKNTRQGWVRTGPTSRAPTGAGFWAMRLDLRRI